MTTQSLVQVLTDANGKWVAERDLLAIVGGSRLALRKSIACLKEKGFEIERASCYAPAECVTAKTYTRFNPNPKKYSDNAARQKAYRARKARG